MMRDPNNPVWDVYDLYRDARLNIKYLAKVIALIRRKNFWIELSLALSAPSSAVTGLWFWDTSIGSLLWRILVIITAILAVAKPLLQYPENLQKAEEEISGYRSLEHDLHMLIVLIRQKRDYDEELQDKFRDALIKSKYLAVRTTNEPCIEKFRNQCYQQVLEELPSSSFYVPGEEDYDT